MQFDEIQSIDQCFLQGSLSRAGEVSFHPPNLEDSKGRLLPKALVPHCSYQGTMMGKNLGNFTYCDKFKPSVLNGQLCYSLNLSQETSVRSAVGLKSSLTIVVDQPSGFGLSGEEKSVATIHIDRIGGYTDSRPGKYFMTALKKMTGTDAFMTLSTSERGCQVESYEDCKTEAIFAEMEKECKCVPLKLANFKQVRCIYTIQTIIMHILLRTFLFVGPWIKPVQQKLYNPTTSAL